MQRRLGLVALLGALACGQPAATQYVGVAMSEDAPESEAKLVLTLYARTDTGTSGVMDVSDPVVGTGYAWAWQDGSELKIVSVDAQDGDTVVWTSKQTDAEIGGRFEIVGGEREGQTGTWRATLTRGPTALSTSQPGFVPPPATASLWPLLVFIGAAVLATGWIRKAPGRVAIDAGVNETVIRKPIAGWLSFFAFSQVVGSLVALYRVNGALGEYAGGIGFAAALPGMEALLVMETSFQLVTPILMVIGMVLFWKRSPWTPRFWVVFAAASLAYVVADNVVAQYLNSALAQLIGSEFAGDGYSSREAGELARQIAVNFAWGMYWIRSVRVRETFGATALDTVWTQPTAYTAGTTTSESHTLAGQPAEGKQWKVAGRLAAGFVALAVVAAIVSWATRVKPYAVPDETDIRDVVTGRWSWATEKPQCGDGAHLIAFSDSGKVMTISTPDIGRDSGFAVTTYDIQWTSSTTIRGAIRGESRQSADGKPVVWDLVLTGPDEYRWRRTDWNTASSYTGSINRCPAPAGSGGT